MICANPKCGKEFKPRSPFQLYCQRQCRFDFNKAKARSANCACGKPSVAFKDNATICQRCLDIEAKSSRIDDLNDRIKELARRAYWDDVGWTSQRYGWAMV